MKKLSIVAGIIAAVVCGLSAQNAVAEDKAPLEEVQVTGTLQKVEYRYILTDDTNGDRVQIPRSRKNQEGPVINRDDYVDKKVTVTGMGYRVERERGKRKGEMETKFATVTSIQEVPEVPEE